MTVPLDIHPEVAAALADGKPVVALESTIITHGMPFPQNIETARAAEAAIRGEAALPATIAVLSGRIKVGLSEDELEHLTHAESVAKLSRADLAACIARGGTGSTTVSATMIAAHMAGIEVFATGGIGGVHKGAETSFDVSADLRELAETPVTVVAAGAKAILDLAKTLEMLETLGVPVITFGQDMFPAFWSRSSGLRSPLRMDTAEDVAKAVRIRREMRVKGGHLVANPIPACDEIPAEDLALTISRADEEARNAGVTGKAVTPFLLDRIFELTAGRSLEANVALVRNNARLGAKIARALAEFSGNR